MKECKIIQATTITTKNKTDNREAFRLTNAHVPHNAEPQTTALTIQSQI